VLLLDAAGRAQLLKRLVIVRSTTGLDAKDECRHLDDDVAAGLGIFSGIGLVVYDSTIQELIECIEGPAANTSS
jgi:hypothetical protein